MAYEDWRPAQPWACPDGQRVLSYKADRPDWLAARRGLLCASDVAKVLGWSKWGDGYTTWLEKTHRAPVDEQTTPWQARGLLFEAPIVELWAAHYRDDPIAYRRQGLMASLRWPHAGASVDWLSVCPLGRCLIEVKSSADMSEWMGDEVPLPFQAQTQWQLYVTGRDHVHIVALGPRFVPVHRLMDRDQVLIDWMVGQLQPWWYEHVTRDQAPPATRRAADAIRDRFHGEPGRRHMIGLDMALRLAVLREEVTERSNELADLVAQVQADAGDAVEIVDAEGLPVASWAPESTVDGADTAWRATHPDLVSAYGRQEQVTVLDVPRMVADHPDLLNGGGLHYRRPWRWAPNRKGAGDGDKADQR